MQTPRALLIAGLFALGAPAHASADVQLAIQGGHVTLVAKDATVRQILAEWARVGQTRIINAERIPGGPVTLELVNVPEREALEVVLRSVSGYLAAQRARTGANSSMFDRIIIMPTSVLPAPVASSNSAPPAFAPPTLVQEQPAVTNDNDDDERPVAPGGTPQNRRPAFAFPPAQGISGGQPPEQAVPAAVPAAPSPFVAYPGAPTTVGAPAGVAAPGMVVPSPQPPQPTIVSPGQPQR